ncbi:claudin-like protein ZF-A89 [Anabas testudineus]|uniref:claudin-like protein ZF-A89 n=1 Tax=Anabas testudineus TaxID=64144 RepID=UPI000E456147|nr:claudin-like protein ZF-A89 [Anabas testudineus]
MASAAMQIVACVLALLGWIGVIIACALPMWRVSAFIGSNIVTFQVMWEGIWTSCVDQSTGQMDCQAYFSMLALSTDLQAARALTVMSIVTGFLGLLLVLVGGNCTNCVQEERAKSRISIAAGVVLIISGLLCLIPVSWTACVIIRDFYNPTLLDAQKRELGASLYIGWAAAGLLILGGALLCASCPPDEYTTPPVKYFKPSGQSKENSFRSKTPAMSYI